MKLSNFKLTKTHGKTPADWSFFAEVDVTTGSWFWKKTVRKEIARNFGEGWLFMDGSGYTPGFEAERLAKVWHLKTGEQT